MVTPSYCPGSHLELSVYITIYIVVDGIALIPTKLIKKIWWWELIDLSRLLSMNPPSWIAQR